MFYCHIFYLTCKLGQCPRDEIKNAQYRGKFIRVPGSAFVFKLKQKSPEGGARSRCHQVRRSLPVGNPKEADGSAVQVRRPSRSAHVSRTRHTAVGADSRMRPATACTGSAEHAGGAPSVATWGGSRDVGGSLSVVEVCILAYV